MMPRGLLGGAFAGQDEGDGFESKCEELRMLLEEETSRHEMTKVCVVFDCFIGL